MICKVCHTDWTTSEIESDGVCVYCWDARAEEWVG